MKLDKNEIRELYIKGYNAKEITKIIISRKNIDIKSDTVQRCINRNFSDLKIEHKKSRNIEKEIKRSIDSMNNSFISNSALLKYNRQSYKYNKNGNLVFDESTRGQRPYDLPKVYYV